VELRNRFDAIRQADADNYLALALPALVLVCDELALVAQDTETLQELTNIARLGRAAGVYCVLATQRPSAAVISGELRALSDWCVAFAVERRAEALVCGIPGAEQLPRQPGRALFRRGDTMAVQAYFAPSWRNDMRSLPMVAEVSYNRLQPVATTLQPALTPQPVAQPALYRRNVALTPEQAAAIRAAHDGGASMNELCRQFYGSKDGAALAAIRAALEVQQR
jgi:DNA segregation ATPase FtsK/SpoIIIE-like protein